MAYYKPCKNCAVDKETCPVRARVKTAIAGQHVTSINFVCRDRTPMFRAGDRVSFPWSHYEPTDWGDVEENKLIFSGTVIAEKGLKFIVRVDDCDGDAANDNSEAMAAKHVFKNENLIIKVTPEDMTAKAEPSKPICVSCGTFASEGEGCWGYGTPGTTYSYWPSDCLKKPSESA